MDDLDARQSSPNQDEIDRNLRNDPEVKKQRIKEYKKDFLDFIKTKVTQEGAATDLSGDSRGGSKGNSNNLKLPKRTKSTVKDSVEDIAKNLQCLIAFSREQS